MERLRLAIRRFHRFTQLNTLAAGLANAVNTVQAGGFDLNGNAGPTCSIRRLLAAPDAAANLSVAITDPSLIAASSDGTAGSNGNAEAMYALGSQALINSQSPRDYYSGIVFNVGNDAANASAEESASAWILQQLNDQLSSVSGVSLDEEAANMVQYQDAYAGIGAGHYHHQRHDVYRHQHGHADGLKR